MRVTQLNYDAIKSAYSSQLGAQQAEISIAEQRAQKAYTEKAHVLSGVQLGLKMLSFGMNTMKAAYNLRQEADQAEASTALTAKVPEITAYLETAEANGGVWDIDADGHAAMKPDIAEGLQGILESGLDPSWTPEVQDQYMAGAVKLTSAWSADAIRADIQQMEASRAKNGLLLVNEAVKADIAAGGGYANTDRAIDAMTWLDEYDRESLRIEKHHASDIGTWNSVVSGYAVAGDYSKAKSYIDSLVASGSITVGSDEYNTLIDALNNQFSVAKKNVATEAQNSASEMLAAGNAPSAVRAAIRNSAEARGYSEEFITTAENAVDTAQLSYATAAISEPLADLYSGTMTADDAKAFKEGLQSGEFSLAFDGIEDDKQAYIKTIDEYIKNKSESEQGAKTSDINAFKNILGGVLDAYNNGSMSFETAKTTMLDLAAADGSLAAQIALESELGKLYKNEVPEIWKNSFTMGFDSIESFIDDMDIEPVEKARLKNNIRAYGISWFAGRKGNSISQGDFDRLLDDMTLMANQEAFKALDHYEEERPVTAIQYGINFSVADSTYRENLDYILDPATVSGISENRDTGGYSFVDERTQRMTSDMVSIGQAMGAAAGIPFDGGWDFIEDANDELLALPVFKSNILSTAVGEDGKETTVITGTRYFTLGYNGLMEIVPAGNGRFDIVNPLVISTEEAFGGKNRAIMTRIENIEQLVKDTTVGLSESQSRADVPEEYGILNEEGDMVDERMLSPEEQGFTKRIEAYENEPIQYRFGNRSLREPAPEQPPVPASQDSGAIAESAASEPDIRVRIVQGEGAQFWYDGNWYLIEKTDADGEVQRAYERYMQSYKGSIPRIRRS